jgi:hypothetical protein
MPTLDEMTTATDNQSELTMSVLYLQIKSPRSHPNNDLRKHKRLGLVVLESYHHEHFKTELSYAYIR